MRRAVNVLDLSLKLEALSERSEGKLAMDEVSETVSDTVRGLSLCSLLSFVNWRNTYMRQNMHSSRQAVFVHVHIHFCGVASGGVLRRRRAHLLQSGVGDAITPKLKVVKVSVQSCEEGAV